MKRYQAIIFDWDGTLYDSIAFIVTIMQQTAEGMGLKKPSAADVRPGIGLSFELALKRLYPDLTMDQAAKFSELFHELLGQEEEVVLFSNTESVIQRLHAEGYMLALASGRRRIDLVNAVKKTPIERYFLAQRGADETQSKPHPQMLVEILDEFKVSPDKALMIGDSTLDIQMANRAKVDALAVSTGVHDRSAFDEVPVLGVLSDIGELLDWLGR